MKQEDTVYSVADLRIALNESVKLQAHYAGLLNEYDGGFRIVFKSVDQWIVRLRERGKLPKATQSAQNAAENLP